MKSFSIRLTEKVAAKKNPVLVGLDPRWNMLPKIFTDGQDETNPLAVAEAYEKFCRAIIDIVAPLVPAVKPQAAFFEQYGPAGMACLKKVIDYASQKELLVILDGKRNDIGSTATAYAAGILGAGTASCWGADALTVSPYLGADSLTPFVDTAENRRAGIFILVKTSNPGGGMLQDLIANEKPIYQHVAEFVESLAVKSWESMQAESREVEQKQVESAYGNIGAVVGATWPEQLSQLRHIMKRTWLLVPGYGSQGGAAKDVAGAFDEKGFGAIINNSRGIIFAHSSKKYADTFGEARWEAAVEAAVNDMKMALAAETSTANL